jgi:predicted phosphodiesterase
VRVAVVSDIHGNGDALDAVAAEIGRLAPDRIYHLGDVVGYNAEPEKCVRWVMERTTGGIAGNHDAVVTGRAGGEFFHAPALLAARWTAAHLSAEAMAYLSGLPDRLAVEEGILLAHGAPSDPDRYLFFLEDAAEEFERLAASPGTRVVFFGHTHIPAAFIRSRDGGIVSSPLSGFGLRKGEAALLNPGSVGQPRDRDPRASFLLFDTRTLSASWIRVPYDIGSCRRKILEAGLPRIFATRLADGT